MVPMLEWVGARKYGGLRHGYRVSIVLSARRACRLHSLLPGTLLAISGLVFFFGACSNQLRVPPEPWQREATQSVATEPIDSVAMVHSARSVFRIDLNMLKEARLAALIQKLHHRDPEVMPGDLPLRMATQNGARALGWPDSGTITPGALADLILLDCDQPHWRPRHDLVANLLHSAQAGDVSHTMVAGRWLMKDRRLLTLDVDRILWEAEKRALALVGGELSVVRMYAA